MSDFIIWGGGTIYLLQPLTGDARHWVDDHLPEDAQTFGTSTVVEPRYIGAIVSGIRQDGFTVSGLKA